MKIWITLKTAGPAAHYPNSRIRIGAIRAPHDHEAAERLLTEQIKNRSNVPIPDYPITTRPGLHYELIGAWHDQRLVGAIFIGPADNYAYDRDLLANPTYRPEILSRTVASIEGLAVQPHYRRGGIGLALKNAATAWANDHGAGLIISVPTTEAARELNKKAGYYLAPRNIILVLENSEHKLRVGFPFPADTVALYALDQPDRTPIHVSLQALTTTNPWRGQQ